MKRLMVLLWTITSSAAVVTGAGRDWEKKKHPLSLGIDVTSILYGKGAALDFSLGIGRNWSAEAGFCIDFMRVTKWWSALEKEHGSALAQTIWERKPDDFSNIGFSMQYWPGGVFKGPFIGIGLRHGRSIEADCTVEAGYRMPISRSAGVAVSLKSGIIEGLRSGKIDIGAIKIGLNYVF